AGRRQSAVLCVARAAPAVLGAVARTRPAARYRRGGRGAPPLGLPLADLGSGSAGRAIENPLRALATRHAGAAGDRGTPSLAQDRLDHPDRETQSRTRSGGAPDLATRA